MFIPPTEADPEPEAEAAPEPEPVPEPEPEPAAPNPDEPEISVWNSQTGITDTVSSPFSRQYTLQDKAASAELGAVPDLSALSEQPEPEEQPEKSEQRVSIEPPEPIEDEPAFTREDVEKTEPENVGVMVCYPYLN